MSKNVGNDFNGYLEGCSAIISQSNFQLVVNSINGRISVPKEIVNLVKNVHCLLTRFIGSSGI